MYHLNKPLRHSKKGALELSINAIVILILAITMLSLGLAFMKGVFKKTTGQLEQVGEDIKNQMIEQLRTSSAKLTLNQEDISIAKSETKEIYFGIKNVEDTQSFTTSAECTQAVDGSPHTGIKTIFTSQDLEKGSVEVGKMIIQIDADATRTTHTCSLKADKAGGSQYAKKGFFLTIQ